MANIRYSLFNSAKISPGICKDSIYKLHTIAQAPKSSLFSFLGFNAALPRKRLNWGRGVFLNCRCMDFFLNRMNSRQGIIKKKQDTIFEISIGSPNYIKIHLKMQFRFAPVFSNDP